MLLLTKAILFLLPILSTATFTRDWQLQFFNGSPFPNLIKRTYTAFTCWLDCNERATIMCYYMGFKDVGNARRPRKFLVDPLVDRKCQQFSTMAYSSGYDRGHMVAANHMDYYDTTIVESMYMTNIMPQTSSLNKNAWLHAEEIFECYRDLENLMTIVGIIMGNTGGDDLFMKSHGVRTPAFYWRIIQKESGDVIAWIMPNDNTTATENIDKYLTSISVIEQKTGFTFSQFTYNQKMFVATASWAISQTCDKS